MDRLQNLDTTSLLLASAGLVTLLLGAFAMGLFSWRNQMPVEGKVRFRSRTSIGCRREARKHPDWNRIMR